ncbi:hypothetical protein C8B47_21525 [filamentous cyanobacterium CCP4]|nr:hypothetical protein C8B47_21525 [filamentous cyanobacterium CCP4]
MFLRMKSANRISYSGEHGLKNDEMPSPKHGLRGISFVRRSGLRLFRVHHEKTENFFYLWSDLAYLAGASQVRVQNTGPRGSED